MIAEELYSLMKENGNIRDEILGPKEVAETLGVSQSFVYHKADTIPHFYVGKMLRFRKSDIYKYIQERGAIS